jgi:flagellar biosynthesis protein FliR
VEIELPQIAITQVIAFGLVLARVSGLFILAPVFSARAVPAQARAAVAAALALALTPLAQQGQEVPSDPVQAALLVVKEGLVGIGFAFAVGAIVAAVQFGAGVVDTLIGFSYASIIDPFSSIQGGVMGQLYSIFVAVVLVVTGGVQIMVAGLAGTYDVVPLTASPSFSSLSQIALDGFARVFVLGLEITAPVIIALIVVDSALALVARAAPQLNVFAVGLPAKILVGVAVVGASMPFVAGHVSDALETTVLDSLRAFKGG